MSTSPPSLETFLVGAKTGLRNAIKSKSRVILVMGDDSAGLDGIVASILFAYFRTANPPSSSWHEVYTPLLNASKSDIKDTATVDRVLSEVGLEKSQLIAVEDLVHSGTTKSGLQADKTRFFLINHNKMAGRHDEDYSRNVLGCIDNHKDEEYVSRSTDPEPRIVLEACSTTSLVVNWATKEWDYLEGGDKSAANEQLAKFALAPILIDTQNLQGNKTEEDVQAVKFLERKLGYGNDSNTFNRNTFYQYLIGGQAETSKHVPTTETLPAVVDTTTTSATTIDNTAAFEKASALSTGTTVGTGSYDPYAKEETTGPDGFAYRFKGDSAGAETSDVEISTSRTVGSEAQGADEITTGSNVDDTAEEVADHAESGGAAGGIVGAATAVLNFFTGKGKSEETEETQEEIEQLEETEPIAATNSGIVNSSTDISARDAKNETASTLASTTSHDTSAPRSTISSTTSTTTTTGLDSTITSKMPWLATAETLTPATSITLTSYNAVDLASILSQDYTQLSPSTSTGLVGISYTSRTLAQLVAQGERDLVNRAIAEAEISSSAEGVATGTPATEYGTGTAADTEEVLKGTPFTAAVRRFAKKKGVEIYVVATSSVESSSTAHSELFLWQLTPSSEAFIPRFEAASRDELGLTRLSEQEEIVKEPGMMDGMMRAYSLNGSAGKEAVKEAIERSLAA